MSNDEKKELLELVNGLETAQAKFYNNHADGYHDAEKQEKYVRLLGRQDVTKAVRNFLITH